MTIGKLDKAARQYLGSTSPVGHKAVCASTASTLTRDGSAVYALGETKVVSECPLCRGDIHRLWRESNFWGCIACSLRFRNPPPSHQELADLYKHSWLHPSENLFETGSTGLHLSRHYVHKLADSLDVPNFKGMNILEFGAGRGDLLQALAENGAEVTAVEPFGYKELCARSLPAYRSLDDLPQGVQFDGVVTVDVIEHLARPWEVLGRLQEFLKSTGWLFISTPNPHSLNSRLHGERWREAKKQGHLIFFSPQSMMLQLQQSGFSNARRLRWFTGYGKPPLERIVQYLLQGLGIDGELRYLAWKR
jgi:SAM-dependent methyltransferase